MNFLYQILNTKSSDARYLDNIKIIFSRYKLNTWIKYVINNTYLHIFVWSMCLRTKKEFVVILQMIYEDTNARS